MSEKDIKEVSEIEVYETEIERYSELYIESLPEKTDIYNSITFTGMLKYIYRYVFKPEEITRKTSILDYADIKLLDSIFNIYTSLCYKYRKKPTILGYCVMTGISNYSVNNWHNGKVNRANSEILQTIEKWFSECENALIDGAIESNSIGCIFALKANYGYSDNVPQKLIIENGSAQDPLSIAEKYKTAALPEKPEL